MQQSTHFKTNIISFLCSGLVRFMACSYSFFIGITVCFCTYFVKQFCWEEQQKECCNRLFLLERNFVCPTNIWRYEKGATGWTYTVYFTSAWICSFAMLLIVLLLLLFYFYEELCHFLKKYPTCKILLESEMFQENFPLKLYWFDMVTLVGMLMMSPY